MLVCYSIRYAGNAPDYSACKRHMQRGVLEKYA